MYQRLPRLFDSAEDLAFEDTEERETLRNVETASDIGAFLEDVVRELEARFDDASSTAFTSVRRRTRVE